MMRRKKVEHGMVTETWVKGRGTRPLLCQGGGGGTQQRGLDGRTACGDGCEGTGQHGDEKKFIFFFFFLSLSG